ncbi:MAG: hypothetical protein VW644_02565 [Alphaproteobacteria bacterium]
MRSIHLFVVMVGIVPALIFATTVLLTGGAPFEPVDRRAVPSLSVPAPPFPAVPDAVTGGQAVVVQQREPDIDRLERMARRGDAEAALLLTILDVSR